MKLPTFISLNSHPVPGPKSAASLCPFLRKSPSWPSSRATAAATAISGSSSAYGLCRTMVSFKPPVACAIGSVPYRMAYSWFNPQGSNRLGISKMSHPAVIRCAIGTLNPTHPRNLSLYACSAHCMNCSSSANPLPSMITCTSSFIMSAMESRIKSGPFCQSSRPMNPIKGTSSRTSKPISCCNFRLHSILPERSLTSNGEDVNSSCAGFHSSMSMPFTTPSKRLTLVSSIASKPLPPSGVIISFAYPSLTVSTLSEVAIAPFKMLTTKPKSSSCARISSGNWYSKQSYHSPGTPRFLNETCGSTPWCKML
mmetsp:Transcript_11617/g.43035  ORF Transcript_11617/g.43035 Transcript_11617/m.43035 type:complete len:311 (+) Transcript_11617:261-1193(+)